MLVVLAVLSVLIALLLTGVSKAQGAKQHGDLFEPSPPNSCFAEALRRG